MKKILMGFALVAVLVTAGCGSAVSEAPTQDKDAQYLEFVRDQDSSLRGVEDDLLLETGKAGCEALDAGATMEDVLWEVVSSDIDPDLGGLLLGAGVAAFCPEYSNELVTK